MIRDLAAREVKRLTLADGSVRAQAVPAVPFAADVLAVGRWESGGPWQLVMQSPQGQLRVVSWEGSLRFELPLSSGGAPLVSAADLTGDGRCELLARTATNRMQVYTFDSAANAKPLWSAPFIGSSSRLSVPARDINGDALPDVLGCGYTASGHLSVRLHAADGKIIWESPLPLPLPSSGKIVKWIVGDFFGAGHPGIFVSAQQDQTREEAYVLDGKDGRIVWTGQPQLTSSGMRACNPIGIPTVFDVDDDGKEDLMLDYRDFVAIRRGFDGHFLLEPTVMPSVPAGWRVAYNSFIPLYKQGQSQPHFLIPLGHGGVGLLQNDLQTEVWFHKPYYDTPAKVGMVDVDGDGRLEVGYEEKRAGWFVCRDLWTGTEEWRLKLAGQGYGPVISADLDGDGKGEFLIGGYCIGTDAAGQGTIRWRANLPASVDWPAIADLDGDGLGEVIMPTSDGLVRVLKAD